MNRGDISGRMETFDDNLLYPKNDENLAIFSNIEDTTYAFRVINPILIKPDYSNEEENIRDTSAVAIMNDQTTYADDKIGVTYQRDV